jgi:hypothetical protein
MPAIGIFDSALTTHAPRANVPRILARTIPVTGMEMFRIESSVCRSFTGRSRQLQVDVADAQPLLVFNS